MAEIDPQAETTRAQLRGTRREHRRPTPQVLIVDDDAAATRHLRPILESAGCSIAMVASTGELAIALTRVLRFDLIVIKACLRGEPDAFQTAAALRLHSLAPILYVTADVDAEMLRRAARTQPCGYLLEPFTVPRTRAAIDGALCLADYTFRIEARTRVRGVGS